jgi:selenocysteine lyase/cysteine desulfurase
MNLFPDEALRRELFPVCRDKIYFAHAGTTPLPKVVADAICEYTTGSSMNSQEFGEVLQDVKRARETCATLIGADPGEIALLGPTSLGLSLVANGIPWRAGDEVLCYADDYPANVYPWIDLRRRGVTVRYIEPSAPGAITPDLVARSLSPQTRLVALASCHYFTGYLLDVDAIGQLLRDRGVLFSVDAIQTLGAFPLSVRNIDFLSADAHKWLLGPLAIGIFYVKRCHFDLVRPMLLGAWNVRSPNFIAQDEITFVPGAQRYEPGALNIAGIYGMKAAVEMLLRHGIDLVASRLRELKVHLLTQLQALRFEVLGPTDGANASSITTFRHPTASSAELFAALQKAKIIASFRHDRQGRDYLRFSPHFYNTEAEIDRAVEILRATL